jgi:hypothetical protein
MYALFGNLVVNRSLSNSLFFTSGNFPTLFTIRLESVYINLQSSNEYVVARIVVSAITEGEKRFFNLPVKTISSSGTYEESFAACMTFSLNSFPKVMS